MNTTSALMGSVLVVTVTVMGVQLLLLLGCLLRIRLQYTALPPLKEFSAIPEGTRRFSWLGWIRARYLGEHLPPYTREDVIREFDRRQSGHLLSSCLARIGVLAPLLGLLLTAYLGWDFLRHRLGELEKATPRQVFAEALPLFVGIAVGALLAFFNQFAVLVVNGLTNRLRVKVGEWFDHALAAALARARQKPDPTATAVEQLEHATRDLAHGVARLSSGTEGLESAIAVVTQTAERLDTATQRMTAGQEKMLAQLERSAHCAERFEGVVTGVAQSLIHMAGAAHAATERLQEAVGQLTGAAKRTAEEAARVFDPLKGAAAQLEACATTVQGSARQWDDMTQKQSRVLQQLEVSCTRVAESQTQLTAVMGHLSEGAKQFERHTGTLDRAFAQAAEKLDGFRSSVAGFNEAVTQLMPSLGSLRDAAGSLKGFPAAMEQLTKCAGLIDEVAKRYFRDAADVGAAVAALSEQLARSAQGEVALQTQVTALAQHQQTLIQVAEQFAETADQVTKALRQTTGHLGRAVNDELAPAVKGMTDASAGLGQALQGLVRMEQTVRSLRELPEAVSEVRESATGAAHELHRIAALGSPVRELHEALDQASTRLRSMMDHEEDEPPRSFLGSLFGRIWPW